MSTTMHIEGACHCGHVAFEADIDPAGVRICHCADCQTLCGSAFRVTVAAREGTFQLLRGEPRTYIKTAESGSRRAHGFCGDCGTPIYSTTVTADGPKVYGLRVGAIRQRAQLRPSIQIWARSAAPWLADLGSIPRLAKQ
jgi:hypothetical protein